MRFGVREICDVVFRPLASVDIGGQHFDAGAPVLMLDTAKTSSLESAVSTVYANGGKGNPRLIGWDGEKTLTFTVEDALMSPQSFALLSGAGVIKGNNKPDDLTHKIYVHNTFDLMVEKEVVTPQTGGLGKQSEAAAPTEKYFAVLDADVRDGEALIATQEAPIYAVILDSAGAPEHFLSNVTEKEIEVFIPEGALTEAETEVQVKTNTWTPCTAENLKKLNGLITENASAKIRFVLAENPVNDNDLESGVTVPKVVKAGQTVRIDCYSIHGGDAQELQIEAGTFAGYYYIEASTLFRDEATGRDLPAEFIIPRGKLQSNFTFTMAASGDPSTFTFTIDAFPGYTKFNKKKKVMAALQIINPVSGGHNYKNADVIGHAGRKGDDDLYADYSASIYGADQAVAPKE